MVEYCKQLPIKPVLQLLVFSKLIKVLKFKHLRTNLPDLKQKKLYKQDNSPSIKLISQKPLKNLV